MFCKLFSNKRYFYALIIIGLISSAFGVVSYLTLPEQGNNLDMLMGMFTGFGAAMIAVSVLRLIRLKMVSPEKLRQEEIARKDERNVLLMRMAYTVARFAATAIFAIMAFVFVALGFLIPAYIAMAGLYVQMAAFLIAYRVMGRKT